MLRSHQQLASGWRDAGTADPSAGSGSPGASRRDRALAELETMEARLARLSTLEPLAAANGHPPAGFASLQLLSAPGYQEAYRCLMILKMGLQIEGDMLRLSLKDLSLLYEYWCYLSLVRAVAEEFHLPQSLENLFRVRQTGLSVQLTQGREQSVRFGSRQGGRITLSYNPLFRGWPQTLIPQQPDMLIRFEDPQWPQVHLVLDAKYRVEASAAYINTYKSCGPPEDALNVLHRYRDAILENSSPTGDARPKRTVVQAAAVFPYREESPGQFEHSILWQSLDRLGVGAIPLLPEHEHYLRQWLRAALGQGGWSLADRVISHRLQLHAQDWRVAASEPVLIGVLRGAAPAQHLDWVVNQRIYYKPFTHTQRRQFATRWLAVYSPAELRTPGAVTHVAAVRHIDVQRRRDIRTPWPARRDPDELQVVYTLDTVGPLDAPIENTSPNGTGQRISAHRWSSRLALERATSLTQLLLETEPEWRLYETLRARQVPFRLEAGPVALTDPHDPAGRAGFVLADGTRIRYAGFQRFVVRSIRGTERHVTDVLEVARLCG